MNNNNHIIKISDANLSFSQFLTNNPLLISIQDINNFIASLHSFYKNTDLLYTKTILLLNSFHVLLNLFHDYTLDKQTTNTEKNNEFLSEYVKLNSLTSSCNNELITLESLRQESHTIMNSYLSYSKLNNELLLQYLNGTYHNEIASSSSVNLLELIKEILATYKSIKDQSNTQTCDIIDNKKEEEKDDSKEMFLLQRINELKEQNELLTIELFKKLSQEKQKEKEKAKIKYMYSLDEKKEGSVNNNQGNTANLQGVIKMQKEFESSMQSLQKFADEIKTLEENNLILTQKNQKITDKLTSFMTDSENIINKVSQLLLKSNNELQSLSKQYNTDINYMKSLLDKRHSLSSPSNSIDSSFNQLSMKSKEINIDIDIQNKTIIDEISSQLTDIINGKYSLTSINRKYDSLSTPRYASIINEIFMQIESIALLISYQKKKIDSQSYSIEYLTSELNLDINKDNKSYNYKQSHKKNATPIRLTSDTHSHTNHHSYTKSTKHNNNDTSEESYIFTKLNHLHKTKRKQTTTTSNSMIEKKSKTLFTTTVTIDECSMKSNNKSFIDNNKDQFQKTESKIKKRIEELKSKRMNEIKKNIELCNNNKKIKKDKENNNTQIQITINDNSIAPYNQIPNTYHKYDNDNNDDSQPYMANNTYKNKIFSIKSIPKLHFPHSVITQYHLNERVTLK